MIYSMTGFGDAAAEREGSRYLVEIKSLNNRYFKPSIRLPPAVAQNLYSNQWHEEHSARLAGAPTTRPRLPRHQEMPVRRAAVVRSARWRRFHAGKEPDGQAAQPPELPERFRPGWLSACRWFLISAALPAALASTASSRVPHRPTRSLRVNRSRQRRVGSNNSFFFWAFPSFGYHQKTDPQPPRRISRPIRKIPVRSRLSSALRSLQQPPKFICDGLTRSSARCFRESITLCSRSLQAGQGRALG